MGLVNLLKLFNGIKNDTVDYFKTFLHLQVCMMYILYVIISVLFSLYLCKYEIMTTNLIYFLTT